jgi:hypothetical protein
LGADVERHAMFGELGLDVRRGWAGKRQGCVPILGVARGSRRRQATTSMVWDKNAAALDWCLLRDTALGRRRGVDNTEYGRHNADPGSTPQHHQTLFARHAGALRRTTTSYAGQSTGSRFLVLCWVTAEHQG